MRIKKFKRFADATFTFQDVNVVVGNSGHGKSSVLNAVGLGATGDADEK